MATNLAQPELPDEEHQRAQLYALLATLLRAPPARELVGQLAAVDDAGEDDGEFAQSLAALGRQARAASPGALDDEYQRVFIGFEQGEVVPFASHYVQGNLYDRPLVNLRGDMARLGIRRDEENKEPEDHVAALAEMMAGLIGGAFGAPAPIEVQREFFDAHLKPWAARFFADLQGVGGSPFYSGVGRLGRAFLEIEAKAFDLPA